MSYSCGDAFATYSSRLSNSFLGRRTTPPLAASSATIWARYSRSSTIPSSRNRSSTPIVPMTFTLSSAAARRRRLSPVISTIVRSSKKDVQKPLSYARALDVEKKVRNYLEVLL